MPYDPATDFVGLWRNSGGNVAALEMPGLDLVVAALARAGVVNLSVSATAPVANQSTTAWLQAAVPSYSAEGALFLWDKITTAYLAATPTLFLELLEASAGRSGVSWWVSTGGAPLNTVGNNGDFAIRTDEPGGIYGPKTAGAWPATALPGTENLITSTALDNTFGTTEGQIIFRGAIEWDALPIGAPDEILRSTGNVPAWVALSALMDTLFGNAQGSILYRDAGVWDALGPSDATKVLSTNGPAANPSWVERTPEFVSGTTMVFYQAAAPVGWTKQTAINDYGLRVVSGVGGGATAGTAFSTVFAQSATAGHALTVGELAPHTHGFLGPGADTTTGGGGFAAGGSRGATNTDSTGAGTAHTHGVNLTLAYADVIIATKD